MNQFHFQILDKFLLFFWNCEDLDTKRGRNLSISPDAKSDQIEGCIAFKNFLIRLLTIVETRWLQTKAYSDVCDIYNSLIQPTSCDEQPHAVANNIHVAHTIGFESNCEQTFLRE